MPAQLLIADPIRLFLNKPRPATNRMRTRGCSVPASPKKKCAISCAWNLGTNVMRTDNLSLISAMLGAHDHHRSSWRRLAAVQQLGDRDAHSTAL